MKKKFLLPVLAVVFAVSGAVASNKFAPIFYYANDTTCSGEVNPIQPCDIGSSTACLDEVTSEPYFYRTNGETSPCVELLKP